ncbi:MAG TPA: HD domain-containing protein [Peptococcaceae bacterium]|jgi:3'-5' exoribonuclease|uniref:3'-5' exoribonuclease YhaM n=1 Tax=anaerobic digester metagenome TaxID=1263854 RepID=A0A485LUS9_9ZZZZ|nr:HD domain-containing protein [Peptococcaceae bacterium]
METFIEQLRPGQAVNGTFALRVKKLLPLRSGAGHYLAVVLGDRTGQMEGRVWESVSEIDHSCRVGDIVNIQGQVVEYNGKAQIQISSMSVCRDYEADPGRFIPSSKIDPDTAREQLFSIVKALHDPHLKNLLSLILADNDFLNALFKSPAAKHNHHAVIGGLLEHSLGIANAAVGLAAVYPQIDRDLLVTGALLHDIGKVEEYRLNSHIDFTDEGRLLGHIILGVRLLDSYIDQLPGFPEELRTKLLHMIVSHHGQYELQSPKRPKFLEAAVLHHLDMIDAAIDMFNSAVENRAAGDDHWSRWVKGLDRFVFCK